MDIFITICPHQCLIVLPSQLWAEAQMSFVFTVRREE